MLRLFRDPQDTRYWFAYSIKTGWVKFPPAIDGWDQRRPADKPQTPFELPLHLAFNTGLLEAAEYWRASAA